MATPLGHAIAGYAVSQFSKSSHAGIRLNVLVLCIFVAALPDLDVIPGLFIGKPVMYHQGISHSLGLAIAVSGIIAATYRLSGKSFSAIFLLCFAAYSSHLALDLIGPDRRPPIGIPLFWPFSERAFLSPVPILLGVTHASTTGVSTPEWIQNLMSLRNVGAIIVEALVITPFIIWGRLRSQGMPFRGNRSFSKGQD